MPQSSLYDSTILESQNHVKFHPLLSAKKDIPALDIQPILPNAHPQDSYAAKLDAAHEHGAHVKMLAESLMENPAEMRKLFHQMQGKPDHSSTGRIGHQTIKDALAGKNITDRERAFLNILNDDFYELSMGSTGKPSLVETGIDDRSLAILEKALNRKLAEDPIYDAWAKRICTIEAIGGAAAGAAIGSRVRSGLGAAIGLLAGTVVGAIGGLMEAKTHKDHNEIANCYDDVARRYQNFVEKEKKTNSDHFISLEERFPPIPNYDFRR